MASARFARRDQERAARREFKGVIHVNQVFERLDIACGPSHLIRSNVRGAAVPVLRAKGRQLHVFRAK